MVSNGKTAGPSQPAPLLLLPEILGFSPQLLLDDIINVANNAVQDGVNGMEEFLQKWAETRAEREGGDWDGTHEVEQGIVAFQTLLEYHTDIAFDFFEAWSLRNIFAIPPDLPIVVPHQQGLDLTQTPERERELMEELENLRNQLDNQRRLQRLYKRAVQVSARQRKRAEDRLERLSFLQSPSFEAMGSLPKKTMTMFKSVSSLPPIDPAIMASLSQRPLLDPGKRQWETSKTGYLNWAVGQLLDRAAEGGDSSISMLSAQVKDVGDVNTLKTALEAMDDVKANLNAVGESVTEGTEE